MWSSTPFPFFLFCKSDPEYVGSGCGCQCVFVYMHAVLSTCRNVNVDLCIRI